MAQDKIPKEAQKKLDEIKKKLEKVKDRVVKKLGKYAIGIALMPPSKDDKGNVEDKYNVLFLIDDNDNKFYAKEELKDKLIKIINKESGEVDKKINPTIVMLSELWQSCYDGKYDLLQLIAMSAPVHDNGMLSAVKIAEVHKSMILKKFEKYIVSYVLAGSLVQGKATPESDIDVFVVIDDTDVKKMTRAELKDKLRAIIIGMGIEAGEMTGIRNKLNVQVYILTDFWDSIKEANPVIFTFLRDGVPFYDRGIFMPWKQLLKMGKIKPSMEAIDMYMHSGEQMLERVHMKMKELGMEDIFYALLTPSQAAIMLYGLPPPTPKETPDVMKDVFVKKENLLEEKYVEILRKTIQTRKDLEHGTKEKITGKELDTLLNNAEDFLKRIQKLFEQIERVKEQENLANIFDSMMTVTRDLLKMENVKIGNVEESFKKGVVEAGLVPQKYLRILSESLKLKDKYDKGKKLLVSEVDYLKKKSRDYIGFMVEYMQRKQSRNIERGKIRFKFGDDMGEAIIMEGKVLVRYGEEAKMATLDKGKFGVVKELSQEEVEKLLENPSIPKEVSVTKDIIDGLKGIVGKDVVILL